VHTTVETTYMSY